jgi:hypothetical protein
LDATAECDRRFWNLLRTPVADAAEARAKVEVVTGYLDECGDDLQPSDLEPVKAVFRDLLRLAASLQWRPFDGPWAVSS